MIMSEYEYLKRVGVPVEKMPEPGTRPIRVMGEAVTACHAARALRNLGYEVIDDPGGRHSFTLAVEEDPVDVVFLGDWMDKTIQKDIEYIVRKFERIGISRAAALFYLAGRCVRINNKEAGKE